MTARAARILTPNNPPVDPNARKDGARVTAQRYASQQSTGSHDRETSPMKLLSINVGLPREVLWQGKLVVTSIFKAPVSGHVRVTTLNLKGDKQSDLSVHGGVDKAVYAYPSEHYPFWHDELPSVELPWGVFGENLTTEGLLEETVHIGDRLTVGSAEFVVTQPR